MLKINILSLVNTQKFNFIKLRFTEIFKISRETIEKHSLYRKIIILQILHDCLHIYLIKTNIIVFSNKYHINHRIITYHNIQIQYPKIILLFSNLRSSITI